MNGILADGPAYLGTACAPFDPQGQARKNMTLGTKLERLTDRRALLESLDSREERDDLATDRLNRAEHLKPTRRVFLPTGPQLVKVENLVLEIKVELTLKKRR